MPHKDPEELRSYKRAYRAKNREKIAVKKSRWRQDARSSNPVLRMYKDAKARAKRKGLAFDIEPADIVIPLCCPLLGVLLTKGPHGPSLDRILSTGGYVKGNIRVISHLANTMKNAATPEQLRMFATNILREQSGRMF